MSGDHLVITDLHEFSRDICAWREEGMRMRDRIGWVDYQIQLTKIAAVRRILGIYDGDKRFASCVARPSSSLALTL